MRMNLNAEELVGLSKENPVKHDKPDVKSKDIAPLSNSSSLFVSNYHLSHQYIRKSIENLYDVIEETTRERDEMAKKNQDIQNQISIIKEQLKEKIKAIHVLERDKFQELSRLQTQLQHVQNEKRTLEDESEMLKDVLSEKEQVIAELQEMIEKIHEERVRNGTTHTQEHQDQHAIKDFIHKEQEINSNIEAVHITAETVQTIGNHLEKNINQLREEILKLKEQYQHYDIYISQHKCDEVESTVQCAKKDERICVTELENMKTINSELQLERNALKLQLKESEERSKIAAKYIEEVKEVLVEKEKLIKKYEESAIAGCQTIEMLQESIETISSELNTERESHRCHIQEVLNDEKQIQQRLLSDLKRAQSQLQAYEESQIVRLTEDTIVDPIHQYECKSPDGTTEHFQNLGKKTESTNGPIEMREAHSIQSETNRINEIPPENEVEDIDDKNDDVDIPPMGRSTLTSAKKNKKKNTVTYNTCGVCDDRAFGFMVKCRQCCRVFHAGCIKSNELRLTSKRRKSSRLGFSTAFSCQTCVGETNKQLG